MSPKFPSTLDSPLRLIPCQIRALQDALERSTNASHSPILSPSPTPSGGSNRTNSLPRQSHLNSHQTPESRRMSSQANLHSSSSSSFTPIPTKKYSGSPASTLQRHKNTMGTLSDLGSSVGDETMSTQFAETLVRFLAYFCPLFLSFSFLSLFVIFLLLFFYHLLSFVPFSLHSRLFISFNILSISCSFFFYLFFHLSVDFTCLAS